MILYTYPNNFRAYKALIAAEYSGVNVKVSPDFVFGVTNKTPEFFEKFRTNNVPVLETADGKHLSESNAIAYFLSNLQLRGGNDIFQQSKVQQWISFADNYIVPGSCSWVFPLLGILPLNKNNTAKADCLSFLNILDKKLLKSTFLVGERITLADIVVFCSLLQLYQHVLEPNLRARFTNVNRWFNTILNQDQVRQIIGSFTLCEKTLVYDPKKFSDQAKANQTKGSATRKQENEKKPKNSDAKEDDDDEETPAQPETNPFDNMPKGLFGLDDFKRCYSNEDESVSIAYFWEKFDAEHYSIWFGEYKYNDELSKVFMSCNLITGMFQRLDKMRKQTFASVCLFGEDNNSSISGVWVWRGQELAFKLSPDWQIDYDCYEWKKLDPSSEETRNIVSQYFSWTGADKKGRKFNQGKIFK